MSDTSDSDAAAAPSVHEHSDGIAAAQSQAHSLVAAIQEQANQAAAKNNDIEQGRVFAEGARTEIDRHLIEIREATAAAQQQLESAKVLFAEVTALQSSAQTNSSQTLEVKAQGAAAFESLQHLVTTATESVTRLEAAKTAVEQAQAVVAAKSEHIESGRIHADKVRSELDRLFTEAQQSATNAEAQHQVSRTASENVSNLYASAQAIKANTEVAADAVAKLFQQCEEHASTTKKLADVAQTTEQRVAQYESRLAELDRTAADRLRTIESLLPGATSAGLASAFNQRTARFKWPQRVWQGVFVICILALIVIAGLEFGLFSTPESPLTWDRLGLSLLHRLPFAVPLVWLAIHASSKAALAQRVEEDYAFKETVSRSFEGFRREMAELEGKAAPESALSRLCTNVLGVISNPPGRIYEKHALNQTPLNSLAESVVPITEAASKLTTATLRLESKLSEAKVSG